MRPKKKILLIRFSSIGDIVLTSPVVRCTKKQVYGSEVHVLTKKLHASLFEYNPYIDRVHVLENSLNQTIAHIKKEQFDFIADLHCNFRSMQVRAALGVPSAGFPKLNIKKYLLVQLKWNLMPHIHVVDRYFEAVKPLGVLNDQEGLDFFTGPTTMPATAPEWLARPYLAAVLGGQHQTKIFPAKKVAEVLHRLQVPVVLLGGQADAARGEEVQRLAINHQIWNACGKLSLMQSAKLIENAAVVLTNDTGLMHIAAAYRKPIVSVWGNTVPAFGMWPYMPGDDKKSVIIENKSLGCRPCSKLGFKHCPKGHFACMNDIDTRLVAEAINSFLLMDQS